MTCQCDKTERLRARVRESLYAALECASTQEHFVQRLTVLLRDLEEER